MPHFEELVGLLRPSQNPPASPIAVGASPFTYQAPANGIVVVSGGTVTSISYRRAGVDYVVGGVAGAVPVTVNDQVKVAYTVLPNMSFIPQ